MAQWHRCRPPGGGMITPVRCNSRYFNASRILTSSNSALALTEPCPGSEQMYHTVDEVDLMVMGSFRPANSSSLHMHASSSTATSADALHQHWKPRSRLKALDMSVCAPNQSACSHELASETPKFHHAWQAASCIELQPILEAQVGEHTLHAVSDAAETAAAEAAETLTQGPAVQQMQTQPAASADHTSTSSIPFLTQAAQQACNTQIVRQPAIPAPAYDKAMAARLTNRIMSAPSPQQLHHVLASSPCAVNHIHVSAALKQLVHLAQRVQCVGNSNSSTHIKSQQELTHHHQSKALHRPEGQHVVAMQQQRLRQELGSQLAVTALQLLPRMSMWELSVIMSNLVRLNVPLKKSYYIRLMTRARQLFDDESTTGQGLAELLCAVAKCGMRGLRADWGQHYCAAVEKRWKSLDLRAASRILHHMTCLRYSPPDPSWWSRLVNTVACHAHHASPQDISNAIWALARWRHKAQPPPEAVAALCGRAKTLWPLFNERETAVILWSVARLEINVEPAWREAALAQVTMHMHSNLGSGLSLALTCYSLGLLGWRADGAQVALALQRVQYASFLGLSQQGLGLLAYGLAQMGYHPNRQWLMAMHKHIQAQHPVLHSAVEQLLGAAYLEFDFSPPVQISATQQSRGPANFDRQRLVDRRSSMPGSGAGQNRNQGHVSAPVPTLALPRSGAVLLTGLEMNNSNEHFDTTNKSSSRAAVVVVA